MRIIQQHRHKAGYLVAAEELLASFKKIRILDISINAIERCLHLWNDQLMQFFRRVFLVILSAVLLFGCRWLAYQLRFDFDIPPQYQSQLRNDWLWVIVLQICWLMIFRQFTGIYKYFSLSEVLQLGGAITVSGVILVALRILNLDYSPPKGVILVQCLLGFLALGGMRTSWRWWCEQYFSRRNMQCYERRNIAIIGAGDVGASLVKELHARPNLGMVPVVFFDDNKSKWGLRIHGVPVVGPPEHIQRKKDPLELREVVIAMPSAPAKRLGAIVLLLQKAQLKYATVPSVDQLTSGRVRISQLRPVKIEDLLGRESIDLKVDQIGEVLKNRTVMVTGAGGSIGSELCRQVASYQPSRLLLVEQSEVQMFQIEQELIKLGYTKMIVPLIADILDKPRMQTVMRQYQPAIIFHAAAHKHVGMMEIQPGEAIKNNSFGTASLAELALESNVERFIMISTDKAVNPTSVMGASKRLAEMFLQAFAKEHPGRTKFAAVRFGNVLGSSGSVVPIFERQIAEGGPITVTDPEVVRFFMTIPEAVGLVLQSCVQGDSGEIFILDMGKPVKISELANQMIKLSGLEPGRDIEIQYIGLRPGEKLYEELHDLRANCTDTAHARIKRLTSEPAPLQQVRASYARLKSRLPEAQAEELKVMLKEILPEYTPSIVPLPNVDASGEKKAIPFAVPSVEVERPILLSA